MVQRHYTGLPGAQSISQINYDLRFSVPVSADHWDNSSTEVNSIENWAVKDRMKHTEHTSTLSLSVRVG